MKSILFLLAVATSIQCYAANKNCLGVFIPQYGYENRVIMSPTNEASQDDCIKKLRAFSEGVCSQMGTNLAESQDIAFEASWFFKYSKDISSTYGISGVCHKTVVRSGFMQTLHITSPTTVIKTIIDPSYIKRFDR